MNQKATRKITPAAVRLLALDAVRGAVIGMLIGTGGSKVLLAAEQCAGEGAGGGAAGKEAELVVSPFCKGRKSCADAIQRSICIGMDFDAVWTDTFFPHTISRRGCCGHPHHTGCWLDRIFDKAYLM